MRHFWVLAILFGLGGTAAANKYQFTCPEIMGAEGALAIERGGRLGLQAAEAYELSQSEAFSTEFNHWLDLAEWLTQAPDIFFEALARGLRTPQYENPTQELRLALVEEAVKTSSCDLPTELHKPLALLLMKTRATPLKVRDIDRATFDFIAALKSDDVKNFLKLMEKGTEHGHLGAALLPQVAREISERPPEVVVRPSGRGLRAQLRRDDKDTLKRSRTFALYMLGIVGRFSQQHSEQLARAFFEGNSRNTLLEQIVPDFLSNNGLYHNDIPALRPIYARLLRYVFGDRSDQKSPIQAAALRMQLISGPAEKLRQLRSQYAQFRNAELERARREAAHTPSAPPETVSPELTPIRSPQVPNPSAQVGPSRRRQKAENAHPEESTQNAPAPRRAEVHFKEAAEVPASRFAPNTQQQFIDWMSNRTPQETGQILRVLSNIENGIAFNAQGDTLTATRENPHIYRIKTSTKTRVWIAKNTALEHGYFVLYWDEQAKASHQRENRGIEHAAERLATVSPS